MQLARFGRLLEGSPDALPGYTTTTVRITDPDVIAASGTDLHPLVLPSAQETDAVEGTLFRITESELAAADDYEVDDYIRSEVLLRSGVTAWAFLDARAVDGPRLADGPA
ncbi:gamma-glutamylcyclotransferase family protein [Streptomyces sp. NPDC002054]|uniref:gamma-glutamylcyclotransferase family protein n=1 Tax=Streptomyces sp. NPDC002054 TaxID=3154663 RepID=UPI003320ACAB